MTITDYALRWKMDDGSGTTATDNSGNGYNGTFSGSPTWSASSGQAGGYVTLPVGVSCDSSEPDLSLESASTISAFVKSSDRNPGGDIFACGAVTVSWDTNGITVHSGGDDIGPVAL